MNNKHLLGLLVLAALSACSSSKQQQVSRIEAPMPAAAPPPPPHFITRAESPLDDPNSPLSRRQVYFADDTSSVQEADLPLLQAHGRYLAAHPQQQVIIAGNCDERGSNEYNLALGQRRADAVKKLLLLGGARESQIQTVSYGEEKPLAMGHDESDWQQNRRADLKYQRDSESSGPAQKRSLSRIEAPAPVFR
ncbi:MAG: peptidoglycan-associated lipoprotein Pal [Gallionella sp.]|nr:peptidoglycan-associated lipoprotein Pal [Gallionella sp.]MDD4946545.1 peptidoglycan-associated lipoprotein Pal [Gallionella sp.]MDD5613026.1 peptidoglycan-associated lipoprotein Pal [Gallionella sp.]